MFKYSESYPFLTQGLIFFMIHQYFQTSLSIIHSFSLCERKMNIFKCLFLKKLIKILGCFAKDSANVIEITCIYNLWQNVLNQNKSQNKFFYGMFYIWLFWKILPINSKFGFWVVGWVIAIKSKPFRNFLVIF